MLNSEKMKFLFFLTFSFCSLVFLKAQTLKVKVSTENQILPYVDIKLINSTTNDTVSNRSDFDGLAYFSIHKGVTYDIQCNFVGYKLKKITNVLVNDSDTTLITVDADKCILDTIIKECPTGKSKKHVIRIDRHLVVSYSFASKRKEWKYVKKLRKQGYRTHKDENEELLLYLGDKEGNNLLNSVSNCDKHLFCKKHKLIFK